jgi:hypothetical protein
MDGTGRRSGPVHSAVRRETRRLTFGLLLVEREREKYEETLWGRLTFPLFPAEQPADTQLSELDQLRAHMEEKLLGSFSVSWNAFCHAEKSQGNSSR